METVEVVANHLGDKPTVAVGKSSPVNSAIRPSKIHTLLPAANDTISLSDVSLVLLGWQGNFFIAQKTGQNSATMQAGNTELTWDLIPNISAFCSLVVTSGKTYFKTLHPSEHEAFKALPFQTSTFPLNSSNSLIPLNFKGSRLPYHHGNTRWLQRKHRKSLPEQQVENFEVFIKGRTWLWSKVCVASD